LVLVDVHVDGPTTEHPSFNDAPVRCGGHRGYEVLKVRIEPGMPWT
jgi:hypothetical protein